MENKTLCIITTDNKFEAVYYEGNDRPVNCIFDIPTHKTSHNNYSLINSGITVSWYYFLQSKGYYNLILTYKNSILFEQKSVKNVQNVIDVLNKFNSMSKSDIAILHIETQEEEKTELEITISKLKEEKSKLEKQIKIFQEIQSKKDEIKVLISKLE